MKELLFEWYAGAKMARNAAPAQPKALIAFWIVTPEVTCLTEYFISVGVRVSHSTTVLRTVYTLVTVSEK